jgi:uncharacterized membrane protein
MESKTKLFGHPIHPMLIVLPLGLLSGAVVFDIVYLLTNNTVFAQVAFWTMAAGILGGLLAAIFGLIDWLYIPGDTRARSVGLWHGGLNVTLVALFALSWFLRSGAADHVPGTLALILSFAGAGLSLISGWLGGELVYRLGMAVDQGANLNAPSSLSGRHPTDGTPRLTEPADSVR